MTDLEALAKQLEAGGAYQVLRRLAIPDAFSAADGTATRLGIVLDVETTGLSRASDEIIELGMIKFEFSPEGRIFRVVDRFTTLREPTIPIPAEVVALTGLTSEIVRGRDIDGQAVSAFVADAVLIIAHNAAFDRPFCKRAWPVFAQKHWACSSTEVDWHHHGHAGSRLAYLLNDLGYFADGHRAMNDCEAVLALLGHSPSGAGTHLGELLARARRSTVRICAEGAPFESKDALKARGYRWFEGDADRPNLGARISLRRRLAPSLNSSKRRCWAARTSRCPCRSSRHSSATAFGQNRARRQAGTGQLSGARRYVCRRPVVRGR